MSEPIAPSTFDRLMQSIRAIIRAELPQATFQGIYEYSIQSTDGLTASCDPVDTTIPLPSLPSVELRPSILGGIVAPARGARCLVAFVNSDPTRPVIISVDGAMEHVITVEAFCTILHNVLFGLGLQGLPVTWLGSGVIPGIINAAITAAGAPAPPGLAAQLTAAAAASSSMLSAPGASSTLYAASIASALKSKTPDVSGLFPSVGTPNLSG